jgi:type I restriction-modification system DNA methylase subunit
VKDTGEIFTPPELVNKMLDELNYDWESKPPKTFLDPTCGSGNFLVEIAKRGVHPEYIYGVDLMDDNIATTKRRLKEIHLRNGVPEKEIDYHHNRNLICDDALKYDYSFYNKWEIW